MGEAREGHALLAQMWVNYYADSTRIAHCVGPSDARQCPAGEGVAQLNDATLGWREEHGTDLIAPKEPGPVHVWAVVHDNRGGAEWARVRFQISPGASASGP